MAARPQTAELWLGSRNLLSLASGDLTLSHAHILLAAMAELEGFICPLCMQALAGVTQLEEHMREEHGDSVTKKVKANFKIFLGKAKTFGRKMGGVGGGGGGGGGGGDVSEGAAAVASLRREDAVGDEEEEELAVTNVSGILPELWPPQEFGKEGRGAGELEVLTTLLCRVLS